MNGFYETLEAVLAVIGGVFVLTCFAALVGSVFWPPVHHQMDDEDA